MTILVAPDSFKGTYTAREVADAIADGIRSSGCSAVELPVADGGEGTLDASLGPLGLGRTTVRACNPWRVPRTGEYGLSADGTAVIEVAEFSGITTAHDGPRDPITADTYGTGLAIVDAVRRGATRVVVAAGGSATTDGGKGAIDAIDAGGGIGAASIEILTDVTTTYVDAARIFGPQKGADAEQVTHLAERLDRYAATLPRDPRSIPGSGAAGGFAGGMWARFDATIEPGAHRVLNLLGFDDAVASASLVVVGEGRLDSQSVAGKIVSAILSRSGEVPVAAVVGSVGDDLGSYRDRFLDVLIATDLDRMREAGSALARMVNLVERA